LAVAATLIGVDGEASENPAGPRRVSFAASSAQVREDRMILLLQEGLVQVKRGTLTCRRGRVDDGDRQSEFRGAA
jgi:hypothetical protein